MNGGAVLGQLAYHFLRRATDRRPSEEEARDAGAWWRMRWRTSGN